MKDERRLEIDAFPVDETKIFNLGRKFHLFSQ